MSKKLKLTIELVPSTSSFNNVRSILPKSEWDRLRKASYKKAKYKCQICGDVGTNQGYNHPVECHEIWEYRKDGTQYLKGLISLCPRCHQVKHIGRSMKVGVGKQAMAQLMKVNKMTKKEAEAYVGYAFQEHRLRSLKEWKINLNVLTTKYGVKKSLLTEAQKKKPKTKVKLNYTTKKKTKKSPPKKKRPPKRKK
jgi:hypothetical protein